MAKVDIGQEFEHKGVVLKVSESRAFRSRPAHLWFHPQEDNHKDPYLWIYGANGKSGVHLSNNFISVLSDEELPELVGVLYELSEKNKLQNGVSFKLLNYSDDNPHYYKDFNNDYLKYIREAISSRDYEDLAFLSIYEDILSVIRGSEVFKLPEMFQMWQNNKQFLSNISHESINYDDSMALVSKLFKLEYLDQPFDKGGRIRNDFKFLDRDFGTIYARSKQDFFQTVKAINATIAKYEELISSGNSVPNNVILGNKKVPKTQLQTDDKFIYAVWSEGAGVAYKKFLFRNKTKPDHEGLAEFIEEADPAEQFAITELGGHITKNQKYLKTVIAMLEQNKDKITKGRLAHRPNSKTRIFNDKFLCGLINVFSIKSMENNAEKYDDLEMEVARRILGDNGTAGVGTSFLYRSTLQDSKKIVKSATDVNYIASLLIKEFGPAEGLRILLEAVDIDFQSGPPTVSQWERYVKGYDSEGYGKMPFEWAIEMVSKKSK